MIQLALEMAVHSYDQALCLTHQVLCLLSSLTAGLI